MAALRYDGIEVPGVFDGPINSTRFLAYVEQCLKSIYSLVALVGFALIVRGFSRYRAEGLITEWLPPARPRRLLATAPGISP